MTSQPLPSRPLRRPRRPADGRRHGDHAGDRRGPGGARGRYRAPQPQAGAPRPRRGGDRPSIRDPLPRDRGRRPPTRRDGRGRRAGRRGVRPARHPGQRRGGEFPLPLGRPDAQRLLGRHRHRRQGDLARLPRGVPRLDEGPRRLDPQHQRDPALRGDAGPAPRRRGEGGGRRPDEDPGRRVGPARDPIERDRPRARSGTPKGPSDSSRARSASGSPGSSRRGGSARSPTSPCSPCSS